MSFPRPPDANPVLLFELRQAVRNRFVLILLMLYMAVMGLLLTASVQLHQFHFIRPNQENVIFDWMPFDVAGHFPYKLVQLIFFLYYVFTAIALVGFGSARMISDRLYENPAFCSMLTPWRIARGKTFFGAVVNLLFLSATFPFLTLVYEMRGVDIRLLFVCGALYFMTIQLHYSIAVAFYAGIRTRIGIIARSVPALLSQVLVSLFGIFVIPEIMGFAIEESFPWELLYFGIVYLLVLTPCVLFTSVQLAPVSSNRMFSVRLTATVLLASAFLLVGAEKLCDHFYGWDLDDFPAAMAQMCFIGIAFLFPIFICERNDISPRIRRTIPRSTWKRVLIFPFYTGVVHAMLWSVLLILAELAFIMICYGHEMFDSGKYTDFCISLDLWNFSLLVFNYCATTIFAYHLFLYRYFSRRWNWVFPFAVVGGVIVFMLLYSFLGGFFHSNLGLDEILDRIPILPTPWPHFDRDFTLWQTLIAVIWFCALIPFGAVWVVRRFREFRSVEIVEAVPETVLGESP